MCLKYVCSVSGHMEKASDKSDKQHISQCVTPCSRLSTGGDTHNLCIACLEAEHAQAALEVADCAHYERLPLRSTPACRSLRRVHGLQSLQFWSHCQGKAVIEIVGIADGSSGGA